MFGHACCTRAPAGLLSREELGSLSDSCSLTEAGGPLVSCFTLQSLNCLVPHADTSGPSGACRARCESLETSMLSGSDSSELSYSTRRSPGDKLSLSTSGKASGDRTRDLVPVSLSRVGPAASEADTPIPRHAAVKPCQSTLRYFRYRTKYSRKQVSMEMRKSRRRL